MLKQLNEVQQHLNAPKSQFNSFGKYKYRSCEDILAAVKPLLDGATIIINDEIIMVGDRYYVKATATFSCEDGTRTATAYAREAASKKGMDESQITGAASSYARKYALNGLLLIDDTKDADHNNVGTTNQPTKKMPYNDIIAEIDKSKSVDDLVSRYKSLTGSISMLSKDEQERITAYCKDIKGILSNEEKETNAAGE